MFTFLTSRGQEILSIALRLVGRIPIPRAENPTGLSVLPGRGGGGDPGERRLPVWSGRVKKNNNLPEFEF